MPLIRLLAAQSAGLAAAWSFLTSLPLPGARTIRPGGLQGALVYFPVVGLTIGALLVVVDAALGRVLARPLVNFALVSTPLVLSGALHLDGLIDTADGLPAPGSAERRLAVMRESWSGQRGAAVALAQLLLQYGALSALSAEQRPTALLLAPTLGRWAIVYGYVAFPYARRTAGLSLALKQGATPATGLAATAFVLLVASLVSWLTGPLLLGAAGLIASVVGMVAQRRLGGMSGDVYGAVEQMVETAVLLMVPVVL